MEQILLQDYNLGVKDTRVTETIVTYLKYITVPGTRVEFFK